MMAMTTSSSISVKPRDGSTLHGEVPPKREERRGCHLGKRPAPGAGDQAEDDRRIVLAERSSPMTTGPRLLLGRDGGGQTEIEGIRSALLHLDGEDRGGVVLRRNRRWEEAPRLPRVPKFPGAFLLVRGLGLPSGRRPGRSSNFSTGSGVSAVP